MQIFISYNRHDLDFANQLRNWLYGINYKVWMDIYDIPAGSYWPDEVDKGLETAGVVIGVMSPESTLSTNVKDEWNWALENKKPLILLMLRKTKVPVRYISLNYIDFTDDESKGFEILNRTLITIASYPEEKTLYYNLGNPVSEKLKGKILPINPPVQSETLEQRNRIRLLDKMRAFWIEDVLEDSLHGAAQIAVKMSRAPHQVENWATVVQHDDYAEGIKVGTGIDRVFDAVCGELLILGAPGSGKTTMLLELAKKLIVYAQEDEQPIPVVLNLSSWSEERKVLKDWILDELNTYYGVPTKVGQEWLERNELTLLLDGLDEVKAGEIATCIDAINEFHNRYSFIKIAVCCRKDEYEAQKPRLRLQAAVVIQPLSAAQVDDYFLRAGEAYNAVRDMLKTDKVLQDLAQTPLVLHVIALAYNGMTASLLQPFSSVDELRKHLFATYVERMLNRRKSADKNFTPEQIILWLTWLAQKMLEHNQVLFFMERMQPKWLKTESGRGLFDFLTSLISTFILVIPGSLIGGVVAYMGFGIETVSLGSFVTSLAVSLSATMYIGVIVGIAVILTSIVTIGVVSPIGNLLASGFLIGILLGGIAGLLIRMVQTVNAIHTKSVFLKSINVTTIWMLISVALSAFDILPLQLTFGVVLGQLLGIGFGFRFGKAINIDQTYARFAIKHHLTKQADENRPQIRPVKSFAWSWQNAGAGLAVGIVFGLSIFLLTKHPLWVLIPVTTMLVNGIKGDETEVEQVTEPNQAIRKSASVALRTAIVLATGITIAASLAGNALIGLIVGSAIAVIAAYSYGLGACLQHFLLRLMLYYNGKMPWNYVNFLNYCVDSLLMRRVGGGYFFIHRALAEYFADRESRGEK